MNRLKKIMESIKRIMFPHYSDREADFIFSEAQKSLEESGDTVARYNRLLKANGVVMRIAIASGHGEDVKK